MSQKEQDRRIDYVEFPATDIGKIKSFYASVFDWKFTDFGPDYSSFEDGRLSGGFTKGSEAKPTPPLVVIFAQDLDAIQDKVVSEGGKITKETFEFPGGRRFHFTDPAGNELAVWSDH